MVRILGLQRAHQGFKFRETAQILKARVLREKRPARESGADASLQPFKGLSWAAQYGEDTRDLIIGMVGMPKGFWAGAGPTEALKRPFGIIRQRVEETEQADDERFFGQELDRFIE